MPGAPILYDPLGGVTNTSVVHAALSFEQNQIESRVLFVGRDRGFAEVDDPKRGAFWTIAPNLAPNKREDAKMTDSPSRGEFEKTIELLEAKAEIRQTKLEGKIDRLVDAITALNSDVKDVKADNKNTRWTIIITVIASVLAALGALWTTQSNLLGAFQAALAVPKPVVEQSIEPSVTPTGTKKAN